jgi:hypothetical protein
MKNVGYGLLESCAHILEAKRHDMICKSAPRGSECGFILVSWVDVNLVVSREIVHEGQSLVTSTIINNLVDKGCWKVFFGIGVIEIAKFHIDVDSALFFVNKDKVGDP